MNALAGRRTRRWKRQAVALASTALVVGACSGSPPGAGTRAGGSTCSPNGTALHLLAKNVNFDTSCLAAPAGSAFTVGFENHDAGIQHNLTIMSANPAGDPSASTLYRGEVVLGPATTIYHVPALAPGSLFFRCDVHPSVMFGSFVVG